MRVVVCLKQVIDPLTPASSLVLDAREKKICVSANSPPVINGFDEQGLEAALRLREAIGKVEIVCLAVSDRFNNDVMKRALAVGADQLVLISHPSLDTYNPFPIAAALAAAIRHLGGADLVICGRQGSDWDNGLVPYVLAHQLAMPIVTLAKYIGLKEGKSVQIERALADGSMIMEAPLPSVVTVTSELGPLRMPTVAARLSAARKQPRQLTLAELSVAPAETPAPEVTDLAIPATGRQCAFIDAPDGASAGARLVDTLLEVGAIRLDGRL